VPFSAEAAYLGEYPLPEHRLFVRNVVHSLLPPGPVTIAAPLNVESIIRRDRSRNRYIVHLVAFIGVRDGQSQSSTEILVPLMEEMWRYRASITLDTPVHSASAHNSDTNVKVQGNKVLIDTEQIHEAVSIEI
jgi:hypothetical protein